MSNVVLPIDLLNRDNIAKKISNIIHSSSDLSPLAIDGSWGSGKTYLCRKTIQLLDETPNVKTIYIDSFSHDQSDSPLLSILGEIYGVLPVKDNLKLKDALISAAKTGIAMTTKAALYHFLRSDSDDMKEEYQNSLESQSENKLNSAIENILKSESEKESTLSLLKQAISEATENEKLVIIVDELDRCSPEYAIKLLDSIKHIFNQKNVFFILSANLNQLESNFKSKYGTPENSSYTDKFIAFKIKITNSGLLKNNNLTSFFINKDQHKHSEYNINFCINYLSNKFDINLRDIEKIILYIDFLEKNNIAFEDDQIPFMIIAIALILKQPSLATKLSRGSIGIFDLRGLLAIEYENVYTGEYSEQAQINGREVREIKDWNPLACFMYIVLGCYEEKELYNLEDSEKLNSAEHEIKKLTGYEKFESSRGLYKNICRELLI